jgi:hypothetical protein
MFLRRRSLLVLLPFYIILVTRPISTVLNSDLCAVATGLVIISTVSSFELSWRLERAEVLFHTLVLWSAMDLKTGVRFPATAKCLFPPLHRDRFLRPPRLLPCNRGTQILRKSRSDLKKSVSPKGCTKQRLHWGSKNILLGATVHLLAWVVRRPGFVHPCPVRLYYWVKRPECEA